MTDSFEEVTVATLSEIKKAFLIGPIENYKDYNVQEFDSCQKFLEERGYVVINPHNITRDNFPDKELIDFFREDIAEMIECDIAFVMPDWATSRSAISKVIICQEWELPLGCIFPINQPDRIQTSEFQNDKYCGSETFDYYADVTLAPKKSIMIAKKFS